MLLSVFILWLEMCDLAAVPSHDGSARENHSRAFSICITVTAPPNWWPYVQFYQLWPLSVSPGRSKLLTTSLQTHAHRFAEFRPKVEEARKVEEVPTDTTPCLHLGSFRPHCLHSPGMEEACPILHLTRKKRFLRLTPKKPFLRLTRKKRFRCSIQRGPAAAVPIGSAKLPSGLGSFKFLFEQ